MLYLQYVLANYAGPPCRLRYYHLAVPTWRQPSLLGAFSDRAITEVSLKSSPHIVLAFDIGGTKSEAAILRFEKATEASISRPSTAKHAQLFAVMNQKLWMLETLTRVRIPTKRARPIHEIMHDLGHLAKNACFEAEITPATIAAIGIGLPGAVNPKTQLMVQGNSPVFIHVDVVDELCNALALNRDKVVTRTANDANCFAYAESRLWSDFAEAQRRLGQDDDIRLGIILGTGVGGGIVMGDRLIEGVHGSAAEFGHFVLDPAGPTCYCGQNGCAEQFLSGTALAQAYKDATGGDRVHSAHELFANLERGEEVAKTVFAQYQYWLTQFLVQLTNMFDPAHIFCGGGVSNQDLIYKNLEVSVGAKAFAPDCTPKITKHHHGDSAGVLGAGLLAWQSYLSAQTHATIHP